MQMQVQQTNITKSGRSWRALAFVFGVLCVVGVVYMLGGANQTARGADAKMAVSRDVRHDSLGLAVFKNSMTYAETKSAIEAHGCEGFQSGGSWIIPDLQSCQVTSNYVSIVAYPGVSERLYNIKIEAGSNTKTVTSINYHNPISVAPHDIYTSGLGYPWRLVYNHALPTVRPFPSDYFRTSDATNPMAWDNGLCPKIMIVAPNGNSLTVGSMTQCKFVGHIANIAAHIRLVDGNLVEFRIDGLGYNGAIHSCRIIKWAAGGGSGTIHDFASGQAGLDFSLVGFPDLGVVPCETTSFRIIY